MKYLWLAWAGIWRKPIRTALMFATILNAFLLFGVLQGFAGGLRAAEARARGDLLITTDRVSSSEVLPLAYADRIRRVAGVAAVSPVISLQAIFRDPKNPVRAYAADPLQIPAVTPAMRIDPAELSRFRSTQSAALVSDDLARTYGWSVGTRVPLQSRVYAHADGSAVWDVDIVGIFHSQGSTLLSNSLYLHYDYVDLARVTQRGTANGFMVKVSDPLAVEDVAETIDKTFANSSAETKTTSEQQLARDTVRNIGDIGLVANAVTAAVFFTLLLSVGAVMLQSVRERRSEIGLLKALGFGDSAVLGLLAGESVLACVAAAGGGLVMGALLFPLAARITNYSAISSATVAPIGLGLAVALGLATGLPPAIQAVRLRVSDALSTR